MGSGFWGLTGLAGAGTFGSLWYWLMSVAAWGLACHFTVGVPFGLLIRAEHRKGAAPVQVDLLASVNAVRMAEAWRRAGAWIAGGAGFVAAALLTLAVMARLEAAQGLCFLLLPLMVVQGLKLRLGLEIDSARLRGPRLRRKLWRLRFANQLIALAALTAAALFGASALLVYR